jgi:serine/threonine protein kinase
MLKSININQIDATILNPRIIQAKQLDVNTILKGQVNNSDNKDINYMNDMVNNKISKKYKITKYIGNGINGKIYLVKDNNNNLYVCKQINLNNNNKNQIEFELQLLQYLSENHNSRQYINPCKDYKIIDDNIITIFPVFNGYSLSNLQNYMVRLNTPEYYKITFYLIKNILKGLSIIHHLNIAHQNITDNSILVSTNGIESKYDLPIKFTDFGLGCGNNRYMKDTKNDIFFNTCSNMNYPLKISEHIIKDLKDSDFLQISQKWDILCLGILFLKLLLPDLTKHLSIKNEYNNQLHTFCNDLRTLDKTKLNIRDVTKNIKNDILSYLDIILKYMTTEIKNREKCNYVLDKLIIYEKYKDDIL